MDDIRTSIFTLKHLKRAGAIFYRLECPDWINVIPLTDEGNVVMVRQYRHGTDEETIEIPGGQMDAEDGDPMEAERRELLEETGYGGGEWTDLGWVHPNPAILNNRCHLFLVRGVSEIAEIKNDEHEHTEVELIRLADVPSLIIDEKITHGLVINAFSRLALHRPDLFPWKRQ